MSASSGHIFYRFGSSELLQISRLSLGKRSGLWSLIISTVINYLTRSVGAVAKACSQKDPESVVID